MYTYACLNTYLYKYISLTKYICTYIENFRQIYEYVLHLYSPFGIQNAQYKSNLYMSVYNYVYPYIYQKNISAFSILKLYSTFEQTTAALNSSFCNQGCFLICYLQGGIHSEILERELN